MEPRLELESESLRWSWDRHPSDQLDSYLVQNLQDPRINCQSILTRAFIIDSLWPGEYSELISDEIRFGSVMSWIVKKLESGQDRQQLLNDITQRSEAVPKFVCDTYAWLNSKSCSETNYITEALCNVNRDQMELLLSDQALTTFQTVWHIIVKNRTSTKISVSEFACGSANDYRFINKYGLSDHIDYCGYDISRKNIVNAKKRFPDVDFRVGNIFETSLKEESVDYVYVHDLFEHLSIPGMETALSEVLRVVRKEAWLHFFNLSDIPEHEVNPVEDYYWNRLSSKRVVEYIKKCGASVEVIGISEMLKQKYGYSSFYNPDAVTVIVRK